MAQSITQLQRVKLLVQICASIAIPLIVAVVGWLFQSAVSEAGLKKDYVQMALGVLQEKPTDSNTELRLWAIAVLDKHSPVAIPDALKKQLVVSQLALVGQLPMGPLEGQTNRQGADLAQSGFQVNIAEECSDMCGKDSKCKAMTFVKHAASHGGICWLKASVPPAVHNDTMISAVKVEPSDTTGVASPK